MGILDPLFSAVTWVILNIHSALTSLGLAPDSGAAWALSIVLLTVCVRILLFPLFVKQIKSSRKMQQLQPQIRELQRKYKNDKQRQQQEMMKLYQESGANPLGGCLPLLVQLPMFIALFQVLRAIAQQRPDWGLTQAIVDSASQASIFGAHIADRFLNSSLAPGTETDQLFSIAGSSATGKIVALALVVTSSVTMFLTIRHSMQNSAMQQPAAGDEMAARQQQMQKLLLFASPFFGLFTLWLPIGVLLYIVTNNVWTLAQNRYIYARYPAATAAGTDTGGEATAAEKAPKGGPAASANGSGAANAATEESVSPSPQPPARRQPVNKPRSKRSGSRKR